MVAPKDHQGIICEAVFFQLVEQVAHPVVHRRDVVTIAGHCLLESGRIRVVRRDRGQGRVVPLLRFEAGGIFLVNLIFHVNLGFMRDHAVKGRVKRLVRVGTVAPVGRRTVLVKDRHRRLKLVIEEKVIGAIIARRPQIFGETMDFGRGDRVRAHVHGPDGGREHPGNNGRTRRGADRGGGKGVFVEQSFSRHPVQVGGMSVIRPRPDPGVTAEVWVYIVRRDKENVRRRIRHAVFPLKVAPGVYRPLW